MPPPHTHTHAHTCTHQLLWDQTLTPHVAAVWLQPYTTRHTVLRLLHPFTLPPWGSSHDVTLLPDLKPPLSCGQTFYPGRGPGPYLTTSALPAQTAEHPGGLPGPKCPRCHDPRLPRSRQLLGLQASSSHGPQHAQPCSARACWMREGGGIGLRMDALPADHACPLPSANHAGQCGPGHAGEKACVHACHVPASTPVPVLMSSIGKFWKDLKKASGFTGSRERTMCQGSNHGKT